MEKQETKGLMEQAETKKTFRSSRIILPWEAMCCLQCLPMNTSERVEYITGLSATAHIHQQTLLTSIAPISRMNV